MMDRAALIAAFEASTNPAPHPLGLPQFPGACVRVLTSGQQTETAQALVKFDNSDGKGNARTLTMILCDADGALLFDVNNPAHVDILHAVPAAVSTHIFVTSNKVNRLQIDDPEEPGKA